MEPMSSHYFSHQLYQSAAPYSRYVEHGNIGHIARIIWPTHTILVAE